MIGTLSDFLYYILSLLVIPYKWVLIIGAQICTKMHNFRDI